MLNKTTIDRILTTPIIREPFDHLVIDDFFEDEFARQVAAEFPAFNSPLWYEYDNPLEVKRAQNFWDRFPPATFRAFWGLCSHHMNQVLSVKFDSNLIADYGLNGGGWHMMGRGGKLNVHQDYSMHPKIPYQRKLNIIIYMSKDWNPGWGGSLQLWSHDEEKNLPKDCVKSVKPNFNRAVIFDTTQNSWHGFPDKLICPKGKYRKSLAIYYLQTPDETAQDRVRAMYAPSKEQENDPEILDLIEKRKEVKR